MAGMMRWMREREERERETERDRKRERERERGRWRGRERGGVGGGGSTLGLVVLEEAQHRLEHRGENAPRARGYRLRIAQQHPRSQRVARYGAAARGCKGKGGRTWREEETSGSESSDARDRTAASAMGEEG